MSTVFLNSASLSNLRKPLFVSWHAQHVNAATGRYKDMSSLWGKTKEAATGDLSLWKHAMRRHPIFRLVPPLEKCFHETVTWRKQGKHLEGCELNKSFIIILKNPRTANKSRTCNMKMAWFYESLTAKSFLTRRNLRLQQMLPSVPRLVGDSRVGSFRKLPGQLRCRQPTHLASAFYTVLVCWRESQQGTAKEVARRYATCILRRVYHGLASDFCQALGFQTCLDKPVRPVLRLLFWRPKMGNIVGWGVQAQMSCGKPLWL